MASILLRSAGAAVGNAILPGVGGAFLGTLGRSLGGSLDAQIGLGTQATGPRLANLAVQDSRYGAGIPIIYGNARVAGNVIWSTDLMQATHTSTSSAGGKGGGVSTTTYTYSVHFAVGIAAGMIGGISTIWADSTIIYQNGIWTSGIIDGASIYNGSATQTPDPLMQSILGAANVPAYRGLAYIVFDNFQLDNFGNRLPNLTFEIVPPTTTSNPTGTGEINAGISCGQQAIISGNMKPIALSGNATNISTVLVGGYLNAGASCVFAVGEFDVTSDAPIENTTAQSASFSTDNGITDCGWALAPDNRYVAMFIQSIQSPLQKLVIYDTVSRSFGSVLGASLAAPTFNYKQIGWIDTQHFIMDDVVGGVRGVHVFARAGLNIIDLGFFGVWGTGSSTTRVPLFYAQYIPISGGLITIMASAATGTDYFTALYGRSLAWQNNRLVVGPAYTIASGLTTGTGAAEQANLLQTGTQEWTLCLGTAIDFHLISFIPSAASATITRPWQDVTVSAAVSSQHKPIYYGDRLVMVEHSVYDNFYRLSEVMLNSNNFSLGVDSVIVNNVFANSFAYDAIAIDRARFLVLGLQGANYIIGQMAIIQRAVNGEGLDAITTDILNRCGYVSGDYDVSALSGNSLQGFVLSEPMSGRAAIEPLRVYLPFDLIESSGQLKAVLRHATADTALPASELRAALEHKDQPPALQIMRTQEQDLPLEINLDYIDPSRNFEVNSQRARRVSSHSKAVQKINLPITTNAANAKRIAETRLYSQWAERELSSIAVSRTWLMLDAGDVIDLGSGNYLRITNIKHAGGLLTLDGFPVNSVVANSNAVADAGAAITSAIIRTQPTSLYLFDLPLLQGTDDQPGLYVAATGNAGWTSATLMRSADGVNYSVTANLTQAAIAGTTTTTLGAGPANYMDNASSVNVQIINGSLSSCSLSDLLNGANAMVIGSEILQFQTATLIGPGLYTLSNLLRGRRGTEWAVNSHAVGENIVLLQSGAVNFVPSLLSDRGATYQFRAISKGQTLGDVLDTGFTYGLAAIQPFAPVNVTGTRSNGVGSDLTISWIRRARTNAEWVNYVDVPLDEPNEYYDVEIMNGTNVMRTFSGLTTPTVTYTTAQQTADWGASIPASVSVNIYQISSRYGRGRAANAGV